MITQSKQNDILQQNQLQCYTVDLGYPTLDYPYPRLSGMISDCSIRVYRSLLLHGCVAKFILLLG